MPTTLAPHRVSTAARQVDRPAARRAKRLALVRKSRIDRTNPTTGESALVALLREGDDAAYETLVRTYGPRMLALARGYVRSQADAEDVLQSAFLLVVRFIHRFEGASRLSTWLHRIVVNCALMRIRSRSRHPESSLNLSAFEYGSLGARGVRVGASTDDEVAQRETHERVIHAVGRLPDSMRAAVRLNVVDGHTFAETSRLLGRSLSSVKTSVQRGRIALRTLLTPRGPAA
jgi:RNA polymerase sigma-70 factor (ECF subfamily)